MANKKDKEIAIHHRYQKTMYVIVIVEILEHEGKIILAYNANRYQDH